MRSGETDLSIPLLKSVSKVWDAVIIPCAMCIKSCQVCWVKSKERVCPQIGAR